MICIVLAAGYATRLYPLTENFPKPLLEVGGKAILDWLLEDIDSQGAVSRFIVVSNARYYDHFSNWARGSKLSVPVEILNDGSTDNENRLGAVRDIQFAIDSIEPSSEDMLVIAGDNLIDFSLGEFINYFRARRATCVMRYSEPDHERLKRSGVAVIGDDDRILGMEEKPERPKSDWCLPPFYIYAASDLPMVARAIGEGAGVDAPGSFIAYLSELSPVYAMEMPGRRYDVGDPESYAEVCGSYKGILV